MGHRWHRVVEWREKQLAARCSWVAVDRLFVFAGVQVRVATSHSYGHVPRPASTCTVCHRRRLSVNN